MNLEKIKNIINEKKEENYDGIHIYMLNDTVISVGINDIYKIEAGRCNIKNEKVHVIDAIKYYLEGTVPSANFEKLLSKGGLIYRKSFKSEILENNTFIEFSTAWVNKSNERENDAYLSILHPDLAVQEFSINPKYIESISPFKINCEKGKFLDEDITYINNEDMARLKNIAKAFGVDNIKILD